MKLIFLKSASLGAALVTLALIACESGPDPKAEGSNSATETGEGDGDGDGDGDVGDGDGDGESGDGDGEPSSDLPQEACDPPEVGEVCFTDGGFVYVAVPPTTVLLERIDTDSEPDLVASGISAAGVRIVPGLGGGGFAEEAIVSNLALGVRGLASGDLDLDGLTDLAVANVFSPAGTGVSYGDGSWSYMSPPFAMTGETPRAVVIAAIDDDEWPDVVVADEAGDAVYVLLNDGTGAVPNITAHPVGDEPYDLAAADFDDDGHTDVVTVNRVDATFSLLWGDGMGGFAPAQIEATGAGPRAMTVADLDLDGDLDLLSADFEANTVSIVRNLGDRSFAPAEALDVGPEPYSVLAVDVSGDQIPDIVSADSGDSTVTIYPSLAPAGSGWGEPQSFFVGAQPFDLAAADLDGDSRNDLAVAVFGASTVVIMLTGA